MNIKKVDPLKDILEPITVDDVVDNALGEVALPPAPPPAVDYFAEIRDLQMKVNELIEVTNKIIPKQKRPRR